MKKILSLLCVALFVTAMGMNIQYSIDGYGIVKNSLHSMVLASETGDAGDDPGYTDTGSITLHRCFKVQAKPNATESYAKCTGGTGAGPFPACPSKNTAGINMGEDGCCYKMVK